MRSLLLSLNSLHLAVKWANVPRPCIRFMYWRSRSTSESIFLSILTDLDVIQHMTWLHACWRQSCAFYLGFYCNYWNVVFLIMKDCTRSHQNIFLVIDVLHCLFGQSRYPIVTKCIFWVFLVPPPCLLLAYCLWLSGSSRRWHLRELPHSNSMNV